jgi:hypothetical protein
MPIILMFSYYRFYIFHQMIPNPPFQLINNGKVILDLHSRPSLSDIRI